MSVQSKTGSSRLGTGMTKSKSYHSFPSLLKDGKLDRSLCDNLLRDFNERRWLKFHGKSQFIDFDDQERAKLQSYFRALDVDLIGTIGCGMLEEVLTSLGLADSREAVKRMVEAVDEDASGLIEFNEFLQVIKKSDDTSAVFKVFKTLMDGELGDSQLSFPLVVSTYRRKMLIDALMATGPRKVRGQRILRTQKAMLEAQMQRESMKDAFNKQMQEGRKIKAAYKAAKKNRQSMRIASGLHSSKSSPIL
eukprot:gene920-230_t